MNNNSRGQSAEELEFLTEDTMDDNSSSMTQNNSYNPNNNYHNGSDGSQGGANSEIGAWFLKQSKHPMVAFFHLFFKTLALFIYIFGSYFTSNYIIVFVVCVILLAFDFWVVKNLSGRLLVGLRWWSMIKEDGSSEFIFESLQDMSDIAALDSRIFWWGMYAAIGSWSLMLFVGLLRLNFQYLPIILAALFMTSANVWGYMKCSADSDQKLKLFQQGMSAAATTMGNNSSAVMSFISSSVMNLANAQQQQQRTTTTRQMEV